MEGSNEDPNSTMTLGGHVIFSVNGAGVVVPAVVVLVKGVVVVLVTVVLAIVVLVLSVLGGGGSGM